MTPSATHNGAGGFATIGFNGQLVADGSRYGNRYGTPILIPLIGGSGGGGATSVGGGGGGGAILIASNVRINISAPGEIRADGGRSTRSGYGSGGAIRLVAPVVSGNGTLTANGGGSADVPFNPGRIRIDTLDRSTAAHQIFPPSSASFGAALVLGLDQFPQLHVLEAAGQTIPVGTGQPVTILLPSGSSPITNVVVEARGFSSSVPVQVALTPEHGQRRVYDGEIAVGANNSGRLTLPVEFLVNVPTLIQVWTR